MLGECECESGKDEEQAENLLIMSQAELQASKATRSKGGQYRRTGFSLCIIRTDADNTSSCTTTSNTVIISKSRDKMYQYPCFIQLLIDLNY